MKTVTLTLCVALLAAMLSACGGSASSPRTMTATPPPAAAPTPTPPAPAPPTPTPTPPAPTPPAPAPPPPPPPMPAIAVLSTSPQNGQTCVLPSASISISFTEAAAPGSINATNIRVSNSSGSISGALTFNGATSTAAFTPSAPLPEGMITVAVQGVTDTAGVAMSQPASFQFSVGGCQAALPAACALSFETFDVPKFSQTTLSKINDSGAMVGSAVDQQQLNHGFLAQDGSVTILDDPAASGLVGTLAMGLSNNGLVAGFYHTGLTASQNGTNHGFILQGSSYTNFDFGTNANTLAKGVNSAGVSVGTSSNPGICCSPSWIRAADGTFTHLEDGLLPDGLRLPTEINDNGVISGASPDGRAFLFANGAFTYFQVPGAQSSSANGLNNAEQVAGSIQVQQAGTPPSRTLGFVKTGDSFCAVEIQNATFTSANDVNAAGVVVGNYLDDKGISHGFIGRPKP